MKTDINNFKYNDGGRELAGYKGKTGDCVTRAIAIATGKPYQEVYDNLVLWAKDYSLTRNYLKVDLYVQYRDTLPQ